MLRSDSNADGSRGLAEGLIPQLLKENIQVLDRTKVLHGPQTQTYRETNYLEEI